MPALDVDLSDEAQLHVGDVGTEIVVTVVDQAGAAVNISGATELTIYLTRPNRTVLTKTAVLDTNGVNGKMKYVTQSGDLSVAGTWKVQGYVAGASGWSGSTREASVEVYKSRRSS